MDIEIEYNLYSLIFAKDNLNLNDEKSVILVNLLYALYRHNDKRFALQSNALGP